MKQYFIDIHKISSETTLNASDVEDILHNVIKGIQYVKGYRSDWSVRVDILTHIDFETKKQLVMLYGLV